MFDLIQISQNPPVSMQFLKIINRGLARNLLHFLIIQTELSSIGQNSDGGISAPVMILWYWHEAKLDKRNTSTSQKIDDYVMPGNCDVIVFIPIYGQFTAIRKPRSGRMVSKTSLFTNNNLMKSENRTKKSLTKLSNYCFE